MISEMEKELQRIFGFSQFRPNQEELIKGLLAGKDVFGIMPTGGGKSLCYQLPAVMQEGCAVVVSPLIALMKDQVDSARSVGIRAACLTSHATADEKRETARSYRNGTLDLLYVAPERLCMPSFIDFLRKEPREKPSFLAIDEAHCISEWGHDFRPDYLFLSELKELFPDVPVAAFTATATPKVATDIHQRLRLQDPVTVRASFDRKNLFYEIRTKTDADRQLLDYISDMEPGASGIIYRMTRKSVEDTADLLKRNGIVAAAYHAGLTPQERSTIQENFINDTTPVIVATVAFGMGIDKPDVRFVAHYDLPKTIEGYYQETGRAGRDGDPSRCLLLYSPGDVAKIGFLIDKAENEEERTRNWTLLRQMDRYAASPLCRRKGVLAYFGEQYQAEKCNACDVCAGNFEEVDATFEARVALSAVARTEGRFGAVHLCDIITGANTERIRKLNHDRLKTYGMGRKKPKKFWRQIIDGLLQQGHLELTSGEYPVPQMTPSGRILMKGESTYSLRKDTRIEPSKTKKNTQLESDPDYDLSLFNVLRSLRKKIAEEEGVPPYVIFGDRTLRQIAAYQPQNEQEFSTLHGIGKTKVEKYAKRFLLEQNEFLNAYPEVKTKAIPHPSRNVPPEPEIKRGLSRTIQETLTIYRQGKSSQEIANLREISESTVITHLIRGKEAGETVPFSNLISPEQFYKARTLLLEHGTQALKPAHEAGNGSVSYTELKIAVAMMQDLPQ